MSRRKNESHPYSAPKERKDRRRRKRKFWLSLLLAALSGLLAALVFAPANFDWLCWIAWTPLIATLWFGSKKGPQSIWKLFGLGYVSGCVYFLLSLFWLREVTISGWFGLSLFLGLYRGLWAVFVGTVGRPWQEGPKGIRIWINSWNNLRLAVLSASAWTALEWARGFIFTGFGWNAQGVALHRMVPLIQIADVVGVYGLSFLVILVNLIVVMTIKRLTLEWRKYGHRPHLDFTLTLLLIAGAFFYGTRQISQTSSDLMPVRIACIQAAIPHALKWNPDFDMAILDDYQKKSQVALRLNPQLLIWPEASTPHPALTDPRVHAVVEGIAQSFSGDFLLGTIRISNNDSFNSAVLFTDHGQKIQIYSKMHLVPFGEYVPLRYSFPLFSWFIGSQIPTDFTPGSEATVFSMQVLPLRMAPLICFEDTLGNLARRFVVKNANFFAVIINDGWFGRSSGSEQHLANAVFRAAEFKLPMVRCSNTGVTCFVDRFGFVTQRLKDPKAGIFGPGVLVSELQIPVHPPLTFYARYGDLFAACVSILAGLAAFFHLARRLDTLKFAFRSCSKVPGK